MALSLKAPSIYISFAVLLNLYLAYKVLSNRPASVVDGSSKQGSGQISDAVGGGSEEGGQIRDALGEIRNNTLGVRISNLNLS